MLKVLDEYGQINWVTNVRKLFFSNGFGYIWIEKCMHKSRAFLSALVQMLKDQYLQSCYAELADSSKLCLYNGYTSYYEHEPYLNCLNIRTLQLVLC